MILDFSKESKIWYIDLPNWTGNREELMMVAGADEALDYFSDGRECVSFSINLSKTKDHHLLNLVEVCEEGGALYDCDSFSPDACEHIWLCDVVKFVFDGVFPKKIYFKPVYRIASNEVRCGNYINAKRSINDQVSSFQIIETDSNTISNIVTCEDAYYGIKLDDKVLKKLGFYIGKLNAYVDDGEGNIFKLKKLGDKYFLKCCDVEVVYLHHLQNIYFDFNYKELKFQKHEQ